ncbi:sugar-binding protein [candidate division KSB1 bacterium]|nr:sugar-binding protein [candidate division KSB1 bacterium]
MLQSSKRYLFISVLTAITLIGFFGWTGCSKKSTEPEPSEPTADYYAPKAAQSPTINGQADDACWDDAEWAEISSLWIGAAEASPEDFTGRYKIVWTEEKLYYLIEITDDSLSDIYANPLQNYWQDDCLELFIDEDNSGGDHECTYNAFAYHIALDYRAVDYGITCSPQLFSDHLSIKRMSSGNVHTWEVAMDVYTSIYNDILGTNSPKAELKANKLIGYANAYCDDDGQGVREHFYGSIDIQGEDKNRAYRDASVFGDLMLVE